MNDNETLAKLIAETHTGAQMLLDNHRTTQYSDAITRKLTALEEHPTSQNTYRVIADLLHILQTTPCPECGWHPGLVGGLFCTRCSDEWSRG